MRDPRKVAAATAGALLLGSTGALAGTAAAAGGNGQSTTTSNGTSSNGNTTTTTSSNQNQNQNQNQNGAKAKLTLSMQLKSASLVGSRSAQSSGSSNGSSSSNSTSSSTTTTSSSNSSSNGSTSSNGSSATGSNGRGTAVRFTFSSPVSSISKQNVTSQLAQQASNGNGRGNGGAGFYLVGYGSNGSPRVVAANSVKPAKNDPNAVIAQFGNVNPAQYSTAVAVHGAVTTQNGGMNVQGSSALTGSSASGASMTNRAVLTGAWMNGSNKVTYRFDRSLMSGNGTSSTPGGGNANANASAFSVVDSSGKRTTAQSVKVKGNEVVATFKGKLGNVVEATVQQGAVQTGNGSVPGAEALTKAPQLSAVHTAPGRKNTLDFVFDQPVTNPQAGSFTAYGPGGQSASGSSATATNANTIRVTFNGNGSGSSSATTWMRGAAQAGAVQAQMTSTSNAGNSSNSSNSGSSGKSTSTQSTTTNSNGNGSNSGSLPSEAPVTQARGGTTAAPDLTGVTSLGNGMVLFRFDKPVSGTPNASGFTVFVSGKAMTPQSVSTGQNGNSRYVIASIATGNGSNSNSSGNGSSSSSGSVQGGMVTAGAVKGTNGSPNPGATVTTSAYSGGGSGTTG